MVNIELLFVIDKLTLRQANYELFDCDYSFAGINKVGIEIFYSLRTKLSCCNRKTIIISAHVVEFFFPFSST